MTDPKEMEQIIERTHAAPAPQKGIGDTLEAQSLGAHIGIAKTRKKISAKYFWRGFNEDVAKFVSECDRCQRSKTSKLNKNHEEMHPIYVESKVSLSMCVYFR